MGARTGTRVYSRVLLYKFGLRAQNTREPFETMPPLSPPPPPWNGRRSSPHKMGVVVEFIQHSYIGAPVGPLPLWGHCFAGSPDVPGGRKLLTGGRLQAGMKRQEGGGRAVLVLWSTEPLATA